MSLVPYVVIWCVLALAVLGLFRRFASLREDGEDQKNPQQVALFHKLKRVDRWGQPLTIIVAASGLLLGGMYVYRSL